jgi:hypothetical protein
MRRTLPVALAAVLFICVAQINQAQAPFVPAWMQLDNAQQTAVIDVLAAWNTNNGGLNFNGYANGEARLVIPVGWQVKVKLFNSSLDLAHSAVITRPYPAGQFPIEAGPTEAAVPRAYTKSPVNGMYNDGDDFDFKPTESRVGEYYLLCGVTTHGIAGMWIHLSIRKDAPNPYLIVEKQPPIPARP